MLSSVVHTVKGIFLDFDGTLSPLNVPREKAGLKPETAALLGQLSNLIPIGIITTKSLSFVMPHTPFAAAWASAGIEFQIADRMVQSIAGGDKNRYVLSALEYARSQRGKDLMIEEKYDRSGQVVAFCVDWRYAENQAAAVLRADDILNYCGTLPVYVSYERKRPFFDIYPTVIDKGESLNLLKKNLGLTDGVLYMGDSEADNPAFKQADISIGIINSSRSKLECDHYLTFEDVPNFFRYIINHDLSINKYSFGE